MSRALNLYRLQQVDSKRDHAIARRDAIQAILNNDQDVRKAEESASEMEMKYAASQHALKQIENQVQDQRIKIEQIESNLYGGHVHNPKELQDLQKDSASLRKHLQSLEEQELELMLIDEAALESLEEARITLGAVEQKARSSSAALFGEQAGLLKDVERLDAERAAILAGIDPSLLPEYDQLRQRKRGVAVALIEDKACNACGASITSAQAQAAQSSTHFEYCSSCGRILYSK